MHWSRPDYVGATPIIRTVRTQTNVVKMSVCFCAQFEAMLAHLGTNGADLNQLPLSQEAFHLDGWSCTGLKASLAR